MVARALEDRLASLEVSRLSLRARRVIVYHNPADVPHLLAETERAGRIAPNHGVLMLPADLPLDEWEAAARARFDRQRV